MTDIAPAEESTERPAYRTDVERIASTTGATLEQVQAIYEREIHSLSREARITQFVGVIAARRVLQQLRGH